MPNYISSNPSSASARRYLDLNSTALTKSQNQLSSGLLTYDPSDLPAASAIGIQFAADLQVIIQATSNATQASALVQLASGTLQASNEILTRMNTLAAQSNSDSVGSAERKMFDLEYQALMAQLDKNAAVEWRGTTLFKGRLESTAESSTSYATVDFGRNGKLGLLSETLVTSSDIFTSGTVTAAAVTNNGGAGYNFSVVIGGTTYSAADVSTATMNSANTATSYITLTGTPTGGNQEQIRFNIKDGATFQAASVAPALTQLDSEFKRLFGFETVANASISNGYSQITGIRPSLSQYFSTATVNSSGTVNGAVTNVAVTANGSNYNITVTVNGCAFTASDVTAITLNGGGTLNLNNAAGDINISLVSGLSIGSAATASNVNALEKDLAQFLGMLNDGTSTSAGTINSLGNFNPGLTHAPTALVGTSTYFAGTIDRSASSGLISGTASAATVEQSGSNYIFSVKIGNETFVSTTGGATPLPAVEKPSHDGTYNGGKLTLKGSVTGAELVVDYKLSLGSSPATPSLSALTTEFQSMFGLQTGGTASSFAAGSTGLYKGTSISVEPSTAIGQYAVSYDYSAVSGLGTFTLKDGVNASITKTMSASIANGHVVDFGNGVSFTINDKASFAIQRSKAQLSFNVDNNSSNNVNMNFQTGLQSTDSLGITFSAADSEFLSLVGSNILTQTDAASAASTVSNAINTVNQQIASLGSKKSQLSYIVLNLSISNQNLAAAKATFTDTDIPQALADAQRFQALVDVSSSVFQQAIQKESKLALMVGQVMR